MSHPNAIPIKLRYESSTPDETRYVFVLGENTKVIRVYVDNLTRRVMISRGDMEVPTHILPLEATMTDEPDGSERADRTGLRVKGTALALQLLPSMPLLLVALVSNVTVGQIISMNDLPIVTDDDLEKFFGGERMTVKPRWFLDVDGPINATNPGVKVWKRHWLEYNIHGYVLRYNPGLINHIRDIANGGLIDVAWCSTWVPYAYLLEEAFHLPPLMLAFEDCTPYTAWTEKVRAVEKFDQTTDQRWAWTDDEAPDHGPVYDSFMESGRGLIIKADHHTGLTPDDIRKIKEHFGMTGIDHVREEGA